MTFEQVHCLAYMVVVVKVSQVFIETRLRSTLKMFLGRCHHLTLPYRVSVTTMVNDICKP